MKTSPAKKFVAKEMKAHMMKEAKLTGKRLLKHEKSESPKVARMEKRIEPKKYEKVEKKVMKLKKGKK